MSVFINCVIRTESHIHLHVVYDVFLATVGELSSCHNLQSLKYLRFSTLQKKFAKALGQILRGNSEFEEERLDMLTERAASQKESLLTTNPT